MREIEAKIALEQGELDSLRERLRQAHAVAGATDEEENLLFDANDGSLRGSGRGLRLRAFAGRRGALLTYKGPVDPTSPYKSREELEVETGDLGLSRRILEQLGFHATARYAKHREHWQFGSVAVTLDRLEFGDYVELEGEEAEITAALSALQLAGRPHIPNGYAELARRHGQSTAP